MTRDVSGQKAEELVRYKGRVLDALTTENGGVAPYPVALGALAWAAGELMRSMAADAPDAPVLVTALAQSMAACAEKTALALLREGREGRT